MPDDADGPVWLSDESTPAPGADDLMTLGAEQPSRLARLSTEHRWLRLVVPAALVVGLAVAAGLALRPHPGATPLASPSVPHVVRPDANDAPLIAVRGLARARGPLPNYVRETSAPGACALVEPGHSPAQSIESAVRRAAPGYRLRDSGMVLDEYTGLCSIEVRATNRSGDALVLTVASPPAKSPQRAFDLIQTGIETMPAATTKYVLVTTRAGFRVLVGSTGPDRHLPTAEALVELAQEHALTW